MASLGKVHPYLESFGFNNTCAQSLHEVKDQIRGHTESKHSRVKNLVKE